MQRKNRNTINYLLLIISLLVVIAPIIPHHHHADGVICMKGDFYPEHSNDKSTQPHQSDNADCTSACISQLKTLQPEKGSLNVDLSFSGTLFFIVPLLLTCLCSLKKSNQKIFSFYRERLDKTYISNVLGLRAPPYIFSI